MARKGSLKRKLRTLSERQAQEHRDLGVAVLAMYRADQLDPAALEAAAEKPMQTAAEITETQEALGPTDESADHAGAPGDEKSDHEQPMEADGSSTPSPPPEPQTEVAPIPPPPPIAGVRARGAGGRGRGGRAATGAATGSGGRIARAEISSLPRSDRRKPTSALRRR